ncbi:MAG: hypothetical protein PHD81_05000 [Candidatus Nanoarchaeia archaeon]|nr:hypothetical protein [Candidatus Nanoarchaeia archaeon]MDD5588436.1 hypothetical protein [Candidatus Nanoarchaeia archaeon]
MNKIKKIGKVLAGDLLKLAYPILGNLSYSVQKTLEDEVGLDNYKANTARKISALTNLVLYPSACVIITHLLSSDNQELLAGSMMLSIIYALGEGFMFRSKEDFGEKPMEIDKASLPGKLVSLPLDYIISVKERAYSSE